VEKGNIFQGMENAFGITAKQKQKTYISTAPERFFKRVSHLHVP